MARSTSSAISSSSSSSSDPWRLGTDLLDLEPYQLCKEDEEDKRPQLAKDEDYASAILKAWREELLLDDDAGEAVSPAVTSYCAPCIYQCDNDDDGTTSLYGYVYRPNRPSNNDNNNQTNKNSLPGILLFHTGAGPQDVFLHWKAHSLVTQRSIFPNGCVVLIADILGDPTGWAWHDRNKYASIRNSILVPDKNGQRLQLSQRVDAAISTLKRQQGVDSNRIGALGFCLGGHAIMELARLQNPDVKAMVTFHGVFDGVHDLSGGNNNSFGSSVKSDNNEGEEGDDGKGVGTRGNVLVCTGANDPFVPSNDLEGAIQMFTNLKCHTKLLSFEETKHGFTNPAQDYNPSDAFAYNDEAYNKAWGAMLNLLQETIIG